MDPHISTVESDVATVRANIEAIHANYATRDALRDSEHRLSLRIEAVRNDLHEKIVETQSALELKIFASQAALELKIVNGLAAQELKMTELKPDMAALSSELRTWFLGTAIAMLVGFGGMSVALFNALKP